MKQLQFFLTGAFFFTAACVFALSPPSLADFRDAVYNDPLNHDSLLQLHGRAMQDIQTAFTGYDLYVASARCDYYMGRSYAYAQNKDTAGFYYDRALEAAQKALDIRKGPEALLIYGENLSQNCAVKPTSYALANGLKVGKLAKQVTDIDPANGAALHLLSAQYIYAPSPFHNYRRGIKEMKQILEIPEIKLENDDIFNITSAIAYAYIQQKKYAQAAEWLEKALAVYPSNFFALDLKRQTEAGGNSL